MKKNFLKSLFFSIIFTIFSLNFSYADLFHPLNLVKAEGENLTERIDTPFGFSRVKTEPRSFAEYVRTYPLKAAESPLLLYNGNEKQNQESHAAIFALPVENEDTQGATGSIIRLYAEYQHKMRPESQIAFHLKNGEVKKWSDWKRDSALKRETRLGIAGNLKKWTRFENPPDEQSVFAAYLRDVMANTNIISMQVYESEPTDWENLKIGDILWDSGKPAHLCLVVDICENAKTGEKAVLLAQGNSPSQEFHIIKNPKRVNDPWYYKEDFLVPVVTPEYVFPKESWRKVTYDVGAER